jgi:hypothetical protein
MSNEGKRRVRFGVRHGLPILKNALVAVMYLNPKQWSELQNAVSVINVLARASGTKLPFTLVCETSD